MGEFSRSGFFYGAIFLGGTFLMENFPGGNFPWGRIILGDEFSGVKLIGLEFSRGKLSGGSFPRTTSKKASAHTKALVSKSANLSKNASPKLVDKVPAPGVPTVYQLYSSVQAQEQLPL